MLCALFGTCVSLPPPHPQRHLPNTDHAFPRIFKRRHVGLTPHSIYDIVGQCPQIIPELRAEVEQVLREHDGVMTTQALFSMKLLDSVMRESQRLSPSSLLRMVRRVMKPFTFADGTAVPAGATVAIPLLAALQDGDHYARPEVFDPYRFLQLRRGEAADPLQYANKEVSVPDLALPL